MNGFGQSKGFTLLEALLSCFIVAIIMGAIVSTMVIAQRGLAAGSLSSNVTSQTARAMQMITLDVGLATAITERTDKAITLVVPDRDNSGQSETIRYAWSGTAGAPLTYQYNNGSAIVLVEKVYQFKLTYLFKTLKPAGAASVGPGVCPPAWGQPALACVAMADNGRAPQ